MGGWPWAPPVSGGSVTGLSATDARHRAEPVMEHIQHLSLESLVKMDHFQKEPPLNLKGTTGAQGGSKGSSTQRNRSEIPLRPNVRLGQKQTLRQVQAMSALPPCVDGSELARTFLNVCSIGRCSHVFGLFTR